MALALAVVCVTQPTLTSPREQTSAVDPALLEKHTRVISGVTRNSTNLEGLDTVARYIAGELRAAGLTDVREQTYDDDRYRNIVATIGGPSDDRIVVGAHYDACEALPGADDNASGVAGLIELARALAKNPPKRTIELVAYSLEEPPFFQTPMMGSAIHAASATNVRAMLSLEMIGYFSDKQSYPSPLMAALYPSNGQFIAVVGDTGVMGLTRAVKSAMQSGSRVEVRSINAPNAVEGIDFSDHASYRARGFPAVMITDTAFNRNLAYHTAEDTPDRLDYVKMAEVVSGVENAVRALAD